jgi:putative transposase
VQETLAPGATASAVARRHGITEPFVKTVKHNYIAFMNKLDVPTALAHLAGAFETYNERYPHKALKPRASRVQTRCCVINLTVSVCPELEG